MDSRQLKELVERLDLPRGEFVIFGGASLTIRELRNCSDLDLFVTKALYNQLVADGWTEKSENNKTPYLATDKGGVAIQAFWVWEGGSWEPKIADYIEAPEVIEGMPFMPLMELYDWKKATARPKDIVDLRIIEEYRK